MLGCLGYPGLLLGYSNVLGVSWGQPLANGCIHIGINTNAPGGCFAQQQVLRSLMMIALMVHLVDGRHTLDQIGDMPSGWYADCYVQRRSLGWIGVKHVEDFSPLCQLVRSIEEKTTQWARALLWKFINIVGLCHCGGINYLNYLLSFKVVFWGTQGRVNEVPLALHRWVHLLRSSVISQQGGAAKGTCGYQRQTMNTRECHIYIVPICAMEY